MSEILQNDRCGATAVMDMVDIWFADRRARVPYQTGFDICAGLRLGCKKAMDWEHAARGDWRDIAHMYDERESFRPNRKFRRSNLTSNVKDWKVNVSGSLVILVLAPYNGLKPLRIRMPYQDWLEYHTWLRSQSAKAKAWAGDKSKTRRVTARLSDANAAEAPRIY